jgi:Fe-S-cluster-containing dehydrogenase component
MANEEIGKSRRKFIKKTATVGGLLAATSVFTPFNAVVFAVERPKDPSKTWWGYGIDIEKCIGCGRCANACKTENNVPKQPFYFRTWVEQYTIKNDGTVKVDSPNGGIDGFVQSVPTEDIFKAFFVPKMCNHCYKSPCVQACPVGATYETPDGVVMVDETYCIGCRYCVQACPYGCRYINPEKNVADKCTLCFHRISKGKTTACVEVCPTQARILGNLNDPKSPLVTFIKEHTCLVLKPHLNTGSKCFYNALSGEVR